MKLRESNETFHIAMCLRVLRDALLQVQAKGLWLEQMKRQWGSRRDTSDERSRATASDRAVVRASDSAERRMTG